MNDQTDEDFFGYPPFDPLGAGGVLWRNTPEWKSDPNWPLLNWETDCAPARPSPRALLDWLDVCLKPSSLLDLRKAFGKRPKMSKSLGNCMDYVGDLRLILKAYPDALPSLRGFKLPKGRSVSVDDATEYLRRFRDRLTQHFPPAEGPDQERLPTAPSIGTAPVASAHSAVPAPRPAATGQGDGGIPACRETAAPSGGAAYATSEKGNGRGKNIDARMMNMISDDLTRCDWSARKWADALRCREGTVKETRAWKYIMNIRRLDAAERMTRDEDRAGSRRKRRD